MSQAENLQGLHLHFDCVSGIAGDMSMGALMDLGVPESVIRQAIAAVGLEPSRLRVEKIVKSGIASTNAWVECQDAQAELPDAVASEHDIHQHSHGDNDSRSKHPDHAHYHYAAIRRRIEEAPLAKEVAALSLRIFDRLARAEATLHGTSVDAVVFHEVGAIDSIVDVVGASAAICWLAPLSISCSPVAMGQGSVMCAHGKLPVPSPAASEIMREAGAPITDGGIAKELCTPTGAAILASVVTTWASMPALTPIAIGYGAGDSDLPDRPNVVRVLAGRLLDPARGSASEVIELESNIDDMSPELCEHVSNLLLAEAALDVWWSAITMKKGRPAWTLHVLCEGSQLERATQLILTETSAIGVRMQRKSRKVLEREFASVSTEFGPITMKIARLEGQIVNAAPEYAECLERARAAGAPLKLVMAAAQAAWLRPDKP